MITPAEILNFIEGIKAIESNNPLYYEKCMLEFLKLPQVPLVEYTHVDSVIYRARENETVDLFTYVTDLNNPEKSKIKHFGRCNRPQQSIFYCAENIHTAYLEIEEGWRDNVESYCDIAVTVGEWGLTRAIKLALVVNPNIRITAYDKKHGSEYDKLVSTMDIKKREVYDIFYEFLSKIFITPVKENLNIYKMTSAFSNLVFMHSDCDGIIYPSVQYKGESYNIILKENVFQSGLVKLNKAIKHTFKKTQIKDGNFEFKEINSVETQKIDNEYNQIIW